MAFHPSARPRSIAEWRLRLLGPDAPETKPMGDRPGGWRDVAKPTSRVARFVSENVIAIAAAHLDWRPSIWRLHRVRPQFRAGDIGRARHLHWPDHCGRISAFPPVFPGWQCVVAPPTCRSFAAPRHCGRCHRDHSASGLPKPMKGWPCCRHGIMSDTLPILRVLARSTGSWRTLDQNFRSSKSPFADIWHATLGRVRS